MIERIKAFLWWLSGIVRLPYIEAKSHRTEELRALAGTASLIFAATGWGAILTRNEITWLDPVVGLTLFAHFVNAAIAGYAMKGKMQIGEKIVELGRDPDPDNRTSAQSQLQQ